MTYESPALSTLSRRVCQLPDLHKDLAVTSTRIVSPPELFLPQIIYFSGSFEWRVSKPSGSYCAYPYRRSYIPVLTASSYRSTHSYSKFYPGLKRQGCDTFRIRSQTTRHKLPKWAIRGNRSLSPTPPRIPASHGGSKFPPLVSPNRLVGTKGFHRDSNPIRKGSLSNSKSKLNA